MTQSNNIYMQRCLDIASIPGSKVAPNPHVGCVIVYDDKIIGEGYHPKYGGPHAEVEAIRSVHDKSILKDSTLYVNLEPCSHHGKTPPCTSLIIEQGIPRVMISNTDPNPLVSGSGIDVLRKAGVEVTTGILEDKGMLLNRRFFKYMIDNRPYVILKWAQSRDHFIASGSDEAGYSQTQISNYLTNILVHKWRSEEQAILVGKNTFHTDKPRLTNRYWSGNQPLRIILESSNEILSDSQYDSPHTHTMVLTGRDYIKSTQNRVTFFKCDSNSIEDVLELLYKQGISSVLVEGGAAVLKSFLESGLWDECRVITGNTDLKGGLAAPEITREPDHEYQVGRDLVRFYIREES